MGSYSKRVVRVRRRNFSSEPYIPLEAIRRVRDERDAQVEEIVPSAPETRHRPRQSDACRRRVHPRPVAVEIPVAHRPQSVSSSGVVNGSPNESVQFLNQRVVVALTLLADATGLVENPLCYGTPTRVALTVCLAPKYCVASKLPRTASHKRGRNKVPQTRRCRRTEWPARNAPRWRTVTHTPKAQRWVAGDLPGCGESGQNTPVAKTEVTQT